MTNVFTRLPLRLYSMGNRSSFTQLVKKAFFSSHPSSPAEKIFNDLIHDNPGRPSINFTRDVIDHWAKNPQKNALRVLDLDSGNRSFLSYQSLSEKSHQIAHHLQKKGLAKGSSVALLLGHDPSWWYSLAGLFRAGIAAVPCPKLLTTKDLEYRITDLKIDGVITTEDLKEKIDRIKPNTPSLHTCITTGHSSKDWNSIRDITHSPVVSADIDTDLNDPCLFLYTSGTTGDPKAVQHNADYPYYHWQTGARWMQSTETDLVYNASDTGWGFTTWTTTAAWAMGSEILITPSSQKFESEKMIQTLSNEGVTVFCAAPTVLRLLAADPTFDKTPLPKLKRIVTVGEALDETVINKFKNHGIEVAVGFGQAETPLIMGRVDDQPHNQGTMGQAITPYKVVILDENHQPLPKGSTGQIAVDLINGKSGGVFKKYFNDPEKSKNSRSPNGQFHLTGDWAHYRKDGLFVYEGRKDDLIKSRGYRIGPDEVEKAGMSHPAIAKIAVVGIRTDETAAITVKAFILLKEGYSGDAELKDSIQKHIKQETGPYKYPRIVEFFNKEQWESYETTSGKIRRVALRELESKKLKGETPSKNR